MSASGHVGGMYSGAEFGEAERNLKRKREEDVSRIVREHGGNQQDAVYRDKMGRKRDVVSETLQQEALKEAKAQAIKDAQYEWGRGAVEKKRKEERDREYEELKDEPFARSIDDPKLEQRKKQTIRDGDPMMAYFEKKKQKVASDDDEVGTANKSSVSKKPIYKGPNPTPNRFGIRPGYRWDAIDRGNGFEKKVLLKINEKSSFNEDEYKWRVSDL